MTPSSTAKELIRHHLQLVGIKGKALTLPRNKEAETSTEKPAGPNLHTQQRKGKTSVWPVNESSPAGTVMNKRWHISKGLPQCKETGI